MCGIVGTIGLDDREIINTMSGVIPHRGPDDQGVFIDQDGPIALAHRRLSIIDLSPAAHQPMSYMDGRYWITYNGEIYNFKAIRAILERKGYVFKSNSDTEVLLGAYAEWGSDCLQKLRGMFAFAIYDKKTGKTFLARDRFGIKPLYYSNKNGVIFFASELKSFLATDLFDRKVDKQAIWNYLSIGSILQPRTILRQIKSLLPGHAMTVTREGAVSVFRYWSVLDSYQKHSGLGSLPYEEAVCTMRKLLEEATQLHMIADVPVGAFLSGGVDSTTVVGLMSQYISHPLKTFSVGFEGKHAKLNELKWARIAAKRHGTDHTEVIVTGNEVASQYDALVHGLDQPSVDGTNSFFVSEATGESVTVALTGQGGDELLAGYPQFISLLNAADLESRLPDWSRNLVRPFFNLVPGRWLPEKHLLALPMAERYAMIRNMTREAKKRKIVSPLFLSDFRPRPLSWFYSQLLVDDMPDSIALTSFIEISGYLTNTLLRDGDAVSMAHSLEVRPVLLDHVLAEYIFALPSRFKLDGNKSKKIMLDALHDLIPEPIMNRKKMGFEMPLYKWLCGPLKDRALSALNSTTGQKIFSKQFLADANRNIHDRLHRDRKLWGYIMLIEWMRSNHCTL